MAIKKEFIDFTDSYSVYTTKMEIEEEWEDFFGFEDSEPTTKMAIKQELTEEFKDSYSEPTTNMAIKQEVKEEFIDSCSELTTKMAIKQEVKEEFTGYEPFHMAIKKDLDTLEDDFFGFEDSCSVHKMKIAALINFFEVDRETQPKIWVSCGFCNSTYGSIKELKFHIKLNHRARVHRIQQYNEEAIMHRCIKCDFQSSCIGFLSVHIKRHKKKKSYQCSKCDFVSVYRSYTKMHIKACHIKEKKPRRKTRTSLIVPADKTTYKTCPYCQKHLIPRK